MVEMPVRRGDRLEVAGLEAERFDVRLDERIGARRPGIDQDQSRPGVDQITAEIVGADVIHVADDLEGRKGLFPFLVGDRYFHALLGHRDIRCEA